MLPPSLIQHSDFSPHDYSAIRRGLFRLNAFRYRLVLDRPLIPLAESTSHGRGWLTYPPQARYVFVTHPSLFRISPISSLSFFLSFSPASIRLCARLSAPSPRLRFSRSSSPASYMNPFRTCIFLSWVAPFLICSLYTQSKRFVYAGIVCLCPT